MNSHLTFIDTGRLPTTTDLQLARPAHRPPRGSGWLHEVKYDGYRVIARLEDGQVALITRNGLDWTGRFPEVAAGIKDLPAASAILDGEIVALTSDGRADFGRLQAILAGELNSALHYQVFDLLYLNGQDVRAEPIEQRRARLQQLLEPASGKVLRLTGQIEYPGSDVFEHACRLGLEGIISKRAGSPYRAGRNSDWLKTVCLRTGDFVIVGYTRPRGSRQHFGALLLGEYNATGGSPHYVGRVGTGFSDRLLAELYPRLTDSQRNSPPLATGTEAPSGRDVTWVNPELVIEVAYSGRTADGLLRHPRFRRLREDKAAGAAASTANEVTVTATRNSRRTGKDSAPRNRGPVTVAGVGLSNPGRILYPEQGISKQALAEYYEAVGSEQLRWLSGRPLSLIRCPEGREGSCFYQKHPGPAFAPHIPRVRIQESDGEEEEYLHVEETADVIGLVQAGVLEIHAWGSSIDSLEQPDLLVFDLDPDDGVPFDRLKVHARQLRDLLTETGLTPFLRVTGGKGLHLVVPIEPDTGWDAAKGFSRTIAQTLADRHPDKLTTNMSKAKRKGRVFIDYLRNGRGATAITNWSTRARPGAPVAVPVRWSELSRLESADSWSPDGALRRLRALRSDPWAGFDDARRSLQQVTLS